LQDAIFGSVYPPDPSILQNYAIIRSRLDTDSLRRYRSLAVAFAVAKRIKGVENSDDPNGDFGRDYQPEFWTDETLHKPDSDPEKEFIRNTADFMRDTRISAIDLYQNAGDQNRLIAYLRAHGIADDWIARVKPSSVDFGWPLMNAMVLLGQRPAARAPKPDAIAWMRYLISQQQAAPSSTPAVNGKPMRWPLFRVDAAPWPLLMPLAHPVPLSEAEYIWRKFQGDYGDDRWHDYGPYRDDAGAMPYMLQPSKWFWDAWPDRIVWGGECVPISKGTVDLYSAMGKPAMWAGQPGHANLIAFDDTSGKWTAQMEQAFAGGPDVTFCQWYFNEDPGTEARHRDLFDWAGAEYPFGLAPAMNAGLPSYMDTRIAVNIFRALPAQKKQTVGVKLLTHEAQGEPFNPEIWYLLGEQLGGGEDGYELTRSLMSHTRGPSAAAHSSPVAQNVTQYWQTVAEFEAGYLLQYALPRGEADLQKFYELLARVPGMTAEQLSQYLVSCIEAGTNEQPDALQADQEFAKNGDKFGQLRMAQRYRDGAGVARNDVLAREYLLRAADQGDLVSSQALGALSSFIPQSIITVHASSVFSDDQVPANLINGNGMNALLHDNAYNAVSMWQTVENPAPSSPASGLAQSPAWVRFDFDRRMKVDSMLIWNHNQKDLTDRGFHLARIYGSADGNTWFSLTSSAAITLPRAKGGLWSAPIDVPSAARAVAVKSVIIAANAANGNYGASCYGLSAVRFVLGGSSTYLSLDSMRVSASSEFGESQKAMNLIDGAGMHEDLHDNDGNASTMWHTSAHPAATPPAPGIDPSRAWVRFDFLSPQKLDSILIWNHNQADLTNRGFRRTRIYGTTDGQKWFVLTSPPVIQLPRATGAPDLKPTRVRIHAPQAAIRSIIISADPDHGNYGSSDTYGLSAVRFVRAAQQGG
jgi:TPR repeat protein